MGLWLIQGGNRLYGTIQVQGAKNGVLPILAACLVHKGLTVLERVPRVKDVDTTLEILRCVGCQVRREGDTVTVDSRNAAMGEIPKQLMTQMRSSILFLGAMAARFGEAKVFMPDECTLGPRPVDLHIAALGHMGAQIEIAENEIHCKKGELTGGEVVFPFPSVGATENAMLAACGCSGETVLRNCAKEPEIEELAEYLRSIGAYVYGDGTDTIRIRPGKYCGTVHHRVLPDRIAAGTLLCAVAACGGKLTLQEVNCSHLHPILDVLDEMGCNIKMRDQSVTLQSEGRLWSPSHEIVTGAFPKFPTDAQPALLAAALKADGVTVVRERMFAGRLNHAKQLRRFGGNVCLTEDCSAIVTGVDALHGAHVIARDIRGGAALIVAALQSEGESRIVDTGKIARGYEFLDATLRQLGADIDYTD